MDEPERITIDVVIPSIRLDTKKLLGTLRMNVPDGVDLRYYVVSDNPMLKAGEIVHNGCPVRIIVNEKNLGAPLSRNVGLEAGTGRYILFIDDDVSISSNMLKPYLDAIKEDPDAPGYIGPTIFPDPINSFTRGIVASSMLTFFEMPANPRLMSWGTTSNLMVRRSAVGSVRFSAVFPRHGGGEDIDFCLRMVTDAGRWFRTVPDAVVRHPWWRSADRSYVRFFRWAFGDSRLVRLHLRYAYWCVPGMVETLAFGIPAAGCLAIAGAVSPVTMGTWAVLVVGSEFAVEQLHVRSHHPDSSVSAALEAAAIRLSNDIGRFWGHLSRRDISCIFKRFDYVCTGEWKPQEDRFARIKFALFVGTALAAYGLGLLW